MLTEGYVARTALLVYVIVLVGFLIALCSTIGVFAAFMAIASWRSKVPAEERRYLTSDAHLAHLGGLAAVLPGPVFASVWAMLFVAEWPSVKQHLEPIYFWTPIASGTLAFLFWIAYTLATSVKVKVDPG